jgi:hypothetical protein
VPCPFFPPPNATEKSTCGVTVTVTGSLNPQPSFSICLLLSLNKMNISSAYGEWMDCVQDLHLQVNHSPQDAGDYTAPGPGAGRPSISRNYLSSLEKSSVNFRSIRQSISCLYVHLFRVYTLIYFRSIHTSISGLYVNLFPVYTLIYFRSIR